jgi:hypothetical protein
MRVNATNALSAIFFDPSGRYKIPFFSRNQTNKKAAILLLPSEKEWFLITKYSRFAAFSSTLGYKSFPPKV